MPPRVLVPVLLLGTLLAARMREARSRRRESPRPRMARSVTWALLTPPRSRARSVPGIRRLT